MKLNILVLCGLLLVGCDDEKKQGNNMPTSPFQIQAGMSLSDYHQRNQLYIEKTIDKQPAGLNFYKHRWSVQRHGNVEISHGKYSFIIPYVLSLTGVEDADFPERGIDDFSIRSSITANEFINHDEARVRLNQTLQELVSLGWQPYIEYYSDPRLSGQQSFLYAIQDGGYAPDPMYMPTLDEWMDFEFGQSWVFHANDVFIKVNFRRNSQFLEKEGKGVYLLNFTILTKEARARNYFQGDERERWQELWVESIKNDKLARYKKEVELIKKGYHINTQYVEPKIHPDDPVEPEGEEVEELLAFIQQNNPE